MLIRAPQAAVACCVVRLGGRLGRLNEPLAAPAGRADVLITASLIRGGRVVGGELRVSVPIEPRRRTTINLGALLYGRA